MKKLEDISLNFIISKERTGSSLLTALLNKHPEILSPSEEPFLLYFYSKYKSKDLSSKKVIQEFYNDFWLMHEKSLNLYFSSKEDAINETFALVKDSKSINYDDFCKAVYLQFLPQKEKTTVTTIIDKQLKYSFHIEQIMKLVPKAKFIFLVREPKANIYSCINRGLGKKNISYQAEIWNQYTNVIVKNQNTKNCLIITYEQIVLNTESTLSKVTSFLNISKIDNYRNHQDDFKQILNSRIDKVNEKFVNHLKEFHSGLLSPIDPNKITNFKDKLSDDECKKIEYITRKNASLLGYSTLTSKISLSDFLNINLARLNKKWLLKFYFFIPFEIKVLIRKLRGKKIDA